VKLELADKGVFLEEGDDTDKLEKKSAVSI
jgi:hypothetical protein